MAWRLGKSDIARYYRLEGAIPEMLADLIAHLARQVVSAVEHCQQYSFDPKGRVQSFSHEPDGLQNF